MNYENKKTNFFIKHKYFFQNFYFKFEGLKPEVKQKFEDIVKNLSATICDDADYILVEDICYRKLENENRSNLYNINYILDSMEANEPLDINMYRFMPTKVDQQEQSNLSPCCLTAKYILRTNSCLRYYNSKFCSSCSKKHIQKNFLTIKQNTSILSNRNKDITNNIRNSDHAKSKRKVISNISNKFEIVKDISKNKYELKSNNGIGRCKTSITNQEKDSTETFNNKEKFLNIHDLIKEVFLNNKKPKNDKYYRNQDSEEEIIDNIKCNKRKRKISCIQLEQEPDAINDYENKDRNFQYKKSTRITSFTQSYQEADDESSDCEHTDKNLRYQKSKRKSSFSQSDQESGSSNEFGNIDRNLRRINISKGNGKVVLQKPHFSNQNENNSNREYHSSKNKKARFEPDTIKNHKNYRDTIKCNNQQRIQQCISLSSEGELSLTSDEDTSSRPSTSSGIHKKVEKIVQVNNIQNEENSGNILILSSDDEINKDCFDINMAWWYRLPKLPAQRCERPQRREGDRRRGSTYTLAEQKVMIAYLVIRKEIHLALSRSPWREMIQEGYLLHRSVESLNNNFRRVLLPKIRTFGLPPDILQQFLNLKPNF